MSRVSFEHISRCAGNLVELEKYIKDVLSIQFKDKEVDGIFDRIYNSSDEVLFDKKSRQILAKENNVHESIVESIAYYKAEREG